MRKTRALLRFIALLMVPAAAAAADESGMLTMGCNWIQGPSIEAKNSGFIDSNANYQIAAIPLTVPQGDEIWIRGSYPLTRYFSFQAYDGNRSDNLLDALPDAQLVSTDGMGAQPNRAAAPYLGATARQYLIRVRYVDAPADAAAHERNVLYAGAGSSGEVRAKQLLYRVYLPDVGADSLGSTALPELLYRHADGSFTPLSQTPDTQECNRLQSYYDNIRSVPGIGVGVSKPRFKPITGDGLYPNGDSAYLRAVIGADYADTAVVRVRLPQFPRARQYGDAVPQVRYWSLCQYGLYSTANVACVADREVKVDAEGYATLVVSRPGKRPELATADHGYNWVRWGAADNALMVLRETLAAPGFEGAYQHAVDAARAGDTESKLQDLIGSWSPEITYCDRDTFDAYAASGSAAVFQACVAAESRRSKS